MHMPTNQPTKHTAYEKNAILGMLKNTRLQIEVCSYEGGLD